MTGEDHHDVEVMNEAGKVLVKKRLPRARRTSQRTIPAGTANDAGDAEVVTARDDAARGRGRSPRYTCTRHPRWLRTGAHAAGDKSDGGDAQRRTWRAPTAPARRSGDSPEAEGIKAVAHRKTMIGPPAGRGAAPAREPRGAEARDPSPDGGRGRPGPAGRRATAQGPPRQARRRHRRQDRRDRRARGEPRAAAAQRGTPRRRPARAPNEGQARGGKSGGTGRRHRAEAARRGARDGDDEDERREDTGTKGEERRAGEGRRRGGGGGEREEQLSGPVWDPRGALQVALSAIRLTVPTWVGGGLSPT